MEQNTGVNPAAGENTGNTKFCQHRGGTIPADAVLCTHCGRQVGQVTAPQPQVVINNSNVNTNNNNIGMLKKPKNKWTALLLCLFLGGVGAHKYYEGKVRMGIINILTIGLLGIGVVVDLIAILFKPNPYYV